MFFLLVGLVFVTTGLAQDDGIFLHDESPISWGTDNITESTSITVRTDSFYQIICTIDKVAFTLSYVTIRPVFDVDIQSDGLVFTHTLARKPSYLLEANQLQATFNLEAQRGSQPEDEQFRVIFQRYGEQKTTTTQPTTTPHDLPTAKDQILVHVSGYSASSYQSVQLTDRLQTTIANMCQDYTTLEKFPLNGTITKQNVKIAELVQCPYNWPGSEDCISLTFSVPIRLRDDAGPDWGPYQLTEDRLRIIWSRYTHILQQNGFKNYGEPDVDNVVKYWAIAISLIVIAFMAILFILRQCSGKISTRKRKFSDHHVGKMSKLQDETLSAHYMQTFPDIFENYDDNYSGPLPYINEGFENDYKEPAYQLALTLDKNDFSNA